MRLPVDDDIYDINGVWLGPPNQTLPFRARYIAYAVGAVIFLVLQAVEHRLGIPFGFFSLAYTVVGTAFATRAILRLVDADRPVLSVVAAFAHEVGAPRESAKVAEATIRPARVRIVPPGSGRATPALSGSSDRFVPTREVLLAETKGTG